MFDIQDYLRCMNIEMSKSYELRLDLTVTHKIDESCIIDASLIYKDVNKYSHLMCLKFMITKTKIQLSSIHNPVYTKMEALRGGGHTLLYFSLQEMLEREMIKETDIIYVDVYEKERLRETKENETQSKLVSYYESFGFQSLGPVNDYIAMDVPIPMWSKVDKIITRCKKDIFKFTKFSVKFEED